MGSAEVGGCDEVLRHVWVYLDHEIDPPTCAEFEAHVRTCGSCQRVVHFDVRFKQLVRRCADAEPVPASKVEALRARVELTLGVRPRGPQAPPLKPS